MQVTISLHLTSLPRFPLHLSWAVFFSPACYNRCVNVVPAYCLRVFYLYARLARLENYSTGEISNYISFKPVLATGHTHTGSDVECILRNKCNNDKKTKIDTLLYPSSYRIRVCCFSFPVLFPVLWRDWWWIGWGVDLITGPPTTRRHMRAKCGKTFFLLLFFSSFLSRMISSQHPKNAANCSVFFFFFLCN